MKSCGSVCCSTATFALWTGVKDALLGPWGEYFIRSMCTRPSVRCEISHCIITSWYTELKSQFLGEQTAADAMRELHFKDSFWVSFFFSGALSQYLVKHILKILFNCTILNDNQFNLMWFSFLNTLYFKLPMSHIETALFPFKGSMVRTPSSPSNS